MTRNDEIDRYPLPQGWVWSRLQDLVIDPQADIVSGPFGSDLKSSDYAHSGVPVIRLQNITRNRFIDENMPCITPQKAEELERHQFVGGDIVITKLGDPLGEACIVPDSLSYGVVVADVVRVRIEHEYILKEYLVYAINSDAVIQQLQGKIKGTTRPRVNLNHIRELEIPLAPINEQRRIVETIEVQLTRLDAAVAALERAQKNLERYKAVMLQDACGGRLVPTEAELARINDREYESAGALLQRILTERRKRWEEEQWQREIERAQKKAAQAKRKAAGQSYYIRDIPYEEWQAISEVEYADYLPKNDKWKQKYKDPKPPITKDLPRLPTGWIWTTLGQLFRVYVGATPRRTRPEYWNGEIPWVSSSEVAFCRIHKTRETITQSGLEHSSTNLHPPGTVLLGIVGEGKTRGQVAILDIIAAHNQNSAAIRVSEAGLPPEYTYYFLEKEYERTRTIGSGNSQPALNKSHVESMIIPLPPLVEQYRIIEGIEHQLSIIAVQEEVINNCLTRAERMCQTILKRAFEGRLVPQDPNDESANTLLGHIQIMREQHEQEAKAKKPKKRRKKVKAKVERRNLYEVLVEASAQLIPEDLFQRAGFNENLVNEFYEEMRQEIVVGRIEEIRPNDTDIYLKAVPNED